MRLIALYFGLCLFLAGCDILGSDDKNGTSDPYTSEERTEAYNVALWYAGELEPPDSLVNLHLRHLKSIRLKFSDSVISSDIPFMTPWLVGEVVVKWDDTTADAIRNGTYTGWQALPPDLRPIDSTKNPNSSDWSWLRFQKPYHPRRLSDTYKTLPGVITAEALNRLYSFGYARLVPCLVEGQSAYYFYVTGPGPEVGDYFKIIDGVPHHIGGWNSQTDSMPSWYSEIDDMVEHFETWDGY